MRFEDLKAEWTKNGNVLHTYEINRISKFNLSLASIEFLTKVGLPEDSAPFLSFVKDNDDPYEGIVDMIIAYDFLEAEFNKYIRIGSDGEGNPIVINIEANDRIEILDHEDDFLSRYMNASLITLLKYLLVYREFVQTVIKENGDEAFLDSNFTIEQFENLKSEMNAIDPKALIEDSFWNQELELLLANREDFFRNKP